MIAVEPKHGWHHLRQEDGGSVMIHTKDGDRFGLPLDDVVKACQSAQQMKAFCQQVGMLLYRLSEWLGDRSPEIERAYLAIEPGGALFVVVRNSKRFDPAFEDALSMLDLEVTQDNTLDLMNLRVVALPLSSEETVASFVDLERSFRYGAIVEELAG
jgi:hypothetical protein